MVKKRYCIVGLGGRGSGMYAAPLARDYQDVAEVAALCDINPHRLEMARQLVGGHVPIYTDFRQMLDEVPCDVVIVATPCGTHHEFIIAALQRDLDVITEKAMTIDAAKCRAILAAEKQSKGTVHVTFNYRFTPYTTEIKRLLQSGAIGDIHSVELQWFLDTMHGADYYRRWHRRKENSGGLLVHKATHHFDMINWFIDAEPQTVFAMGQRSFYGPTRENRGDRCLDCVYSSSCEFYMDLNQHRQYRALYLEAESHDGYQRDKCIFSPEINIEDTMHVLVRYTKGIQLSYVLQSYAPFEGWRLVVNGSKGRLEANEPHSYVPAEQLELAQRTRASKAIDAWAAARGEEAVETEGLIRIYGLHGGVTVHPVPKRQGDHGGGDARLRDLLFRAHMPDPLEHAAGSWAGAMSVLIGAAANLSMESNEVMSIPQLLGPEFAPQRWHVA